MNQDERYTAVIIGIASDAAKAISVWEAFRQFFLDYADEVVEALAPMAEAEPFPKKRTQKAKKKWRDTRREREIKSGSK